jgi:hypothetical protein
LAKSGSRARYPEHSMHRGGRVHPTILARLLLYERQPGATSLGAPLLALKDFAGWPRTCPLPGEGHISIPAPFTVRAPHLEESNQHTFRTIRVPGPDILRRLTDEHRPGETVEIRGLVASLSLVARGRPSRIPTQTRSASGFHPA